MSSILVNDVFNSTCGNVFSGTNGEASGKELRDTQGEAFVCTCGRDFRDTQGEDFVCSCGKDSRDTHGETVLHCKECGKGFSFECGNICTGDCEEGILCVDDFLVTARILEEHEFLLDSGEESVNVNSGFYETSDRLKIVCANVDSLTNKMDELSVRVLCDRPDVICLQEVLPKNPSEEIQVEIEFKVDGYDMYKPNTMKRGVVTLIRSEIQAIQIEPTEQFEESVWCVIMDQSSEKTLIGNIYRSPSSGSDNAERMCSAVSEMCGKGFAQVVICGDFNMKEIDWGSRHAQAAEGHPASLFLECMDDNFLHQHVTESTRFRDGQASNLLDLVITDREDNVTQLDYEMPIGRSDHVCLRFEVICHRNTRKEGFKRKYFKGNYQEIRSDVDRIDWDNALQGKDTEESWQMLERVVKESIERNIPMQKIGNKFKKKWMTKETLSVVKEKHRAYKKYRKLGTEESKESYNKAKQEAIYVTRKARMEFETRIANNFKDNPKEFYSYVNNKTTVRSEIAVLTKSDGELAVLPQEKADTLNQFFASVFTKEDMANIPQPDKKVWSSQLSTITVTEEMVRERLKEQKPGKSAGPDGIHSKVVVEAQEQLVKPLTLIFNKSLREGVVPRSWKEAEVVPIFKKGKRNNPGNYRPVSLTSVCGKILEKIVRKEMIDHLDRNGIITEKQHGFVQGRSCQTQLLTVVEDWSQWMEERKPFDCVYMDYRKAFDSVPHMRLLKKVESCGIVGDIQRWIASFLIGRRQRVRVGEELSGWRKVTSGIPQGSVLGPTLFVIYINDLPEIVDSPVALFADDTKVFRVVQSEEDRQKLQEDIDELDKWSKKWQLPFNESKCKVMHYGRGNRRSEYDIGGVRMMEVEEEKDLGVTFDAQLSFSTNTSKVVAAANSRLGLINRHFMHMETKPFMNLYKSLVRPKVEYCMAVAQPVYKKDKDRIERVQRRATKLVQGMEGKEYSERLEELKLPSLEYRRKRADVLQAYRMVTKVDRIEEEKFFKPSKEVRTRGHSKKVQKTHCRSLVRRNTFSQRVVNEWNALPEAVVMSDSVNQFKGRLGRWWGSDPMLYLKPKSPNVTMHTLVASFNAGEGNQPR